MEGERAWGASMVLGAALMQPPRAKCSAPSRSGPELEGTGIARGHLVLTTALQKSESSLEECSTLDMCPEMNH